MKHVRYLCAFTIGALSLGVTPLTAQVAGEIRQAVLAPNSTTNSPLPVVGSWNAATEWNIGTSGEGFSPSWQMQQIAAGHHMMPWFEIPLPGGTVTPEMINYYQSALQQAAQLNLPIAFKGTQWEQNLYTDPTYFNLPYAQNPNVSDLNGNPVAMVSPFGALAPWTQLGVAWGSSPLMTQLRQWYPNPPAVFFISNNEAHILTWTAVETDKHYLDLYGKGQGDDFKRQVVGQGWIDRYRALQQGFRSGLVNSAWRNAAVFSGFNAFGPSWFGRFYGWMDYSLYIPNRIDPNPLIWDSGSPQVYLATFLKNTDFQVYSPQFDSMNWNFMLNEAWQLDPNFWFEISVWDGDAAQRDYFASLGQTYTPERYSGVVQFAMWLLKPRSVRDYREYNMPRSTTLPWFTPVIDAVDRVYNNATLQRFWRGGQLVANTSRTHPYETQVPPEYQSANRMFLLNTNLDPAQPWALSTQIPVFSLARVLGSSPQRQWLLYAHSPLGPRTGVQITIPSYRAVTVDVSLAGSFYLVDEASGGVTPITDTPPGSISVAVTPSAVTLTSGTTQQFTASVTGSTNTSVTWQMSPAVGTLSASGLYTAPTGITQSQALTITATSVADTTKKAYSTVTLSPVAVSVSPANAYLSWGQSRQFTATVTGTTNTAVTWSINPAMGTITSSGLYTAPRWVSAQTVTVTATSVVDPSRSASATVTATRRR